MRGRRHAGPSSGEADRGGLPTEATVAQVPVSKYADHLPLYRQAQIYARQGIHLDRSTLADWVGHAAFHLRPLHERLLTALRARSKLFADETTVPVLDPGRGRTKTGQLWAYAADDRPWGGLDPPGIAYVYPTDPQGRAAVYPSCRLQGRPAGRWLQRLSKACGSRRGRARILLGAHAAQLLRTRSSRPRTHRKRGAEAHHRHLRDREGDPRSQPGIAPPRATAEEPAFGRRL